MSLPNDSSLILHLLHRKSNVNETFEKNSKIPPELNMTPS